MNNEFESIFGTLFRGPKKRTAEEIRREAVARSEAGIPVDWFQVAKEMLEAEK
jgi:hypothetical protein